MRIGDTNAVMPLEVHIFAYSAFGEGLSGGDNIFIQLAKHWSQYGASITIHLFRDGFEICRRAGLESSQNVDFQIVENKCGSPNLLPIFFLLRTIFGIREAGKIKVAPGRKTWIYSSSDFWPDALPAFLFSKIFRRNKWIAGFYMFAPRPLSINFPYKGINKLRGWFYYLTQRPIYWIVRRFADLVFVTSEPDVEEFLTPSRGQDKIAVVKGGVDLDFIKSVSPVPPGQSFDAVFMGRLHPQKGVSELLEIWRIVLQKNPHLKLAIIGDGYMRAEIENKIKLLGLEKNIILLGYKFGVEKYRILKSSRIVLHPAVYDSGGMASSEAMACGLPGVSFDLEALKTYYPKGMLKTTCFDFREFADNILRLFTDRFLYDRLSREAKDLTKTGWDWKARARTLFEKITAAED